MELITNEISACTRDPPLGPPSTQVDIFPRTCLQSRVTFKIFGNKRSRNITWFNPPYSANVVTSIGAKFLKILDTCFPTTHSL